MVLEYTPKAVSLDIPQADAALVLATETESPMPCDLLVMAKEAVMEAVSLVTANARGTLMDSTA